MSNPFAAAKEMFKAIRAALKLPMHEKQSALAEIGPYRSRGKGGKHADGGPAFPTSAENSPMGGARGMSLREYFAAHAPDPPFWWRHDMEHEDQFYRWRWHYADAMLEERRQR